MPLKLKIFSVGKTKESWLEEALREYFKRLKPHITVEQIYFKDDAHLVEAVEGEKNVLCCDQRGNQLTSEEYASYLKTLFEKGNGRLTIVIGASEGLPEHFRQKYPLFSFSKLTFTHQMVRLILVEQTYRATQIWLNTPYHK